MIEEIKVKEIMEDIEALSKRLGYPITKSDYEVVVLGCPHSWPKTLPKGYVGIYMFFYKGKALKIGKANANSKSRFTSQHYRFNAESTLAKSIRDDNDIQFDNKEIQDVVKEWIRTNTSRINILVKIDPVRSNEKAITELIETVMHFAFRPKYEGALYYSKKKENKYEDKIS